MISSITGLLWLIGGCVPNCHFLRDVILVEHGLRRVLRQRRVGKGYRRKRAEYDAEEVFSFCYELEAKSIRRRRHCLPSR